MKPISERRSRAKLVYGPCTLVVKVYWLSGNCSPKKVNNETDADFNYYRTLSLKISIIEKRI